MKKTRIFIAILVLVMTTLIISSSCKKKESTQVNNAGEGYSVPSGDPNFPVLGEYWVIDKAGALSKETIVKCDAICQRLKQDRIAEVVVLVQQGVKHPTDYATHYGRFLNLGEKGLSTEGGNNGLVWLIRPDATEKFTPSVGRGLPLLTASHLIDIINRSKEYINFNNYDEGIIVLVQETDKTLREIYGKRRQTQEK